jgi:hypothetical protein
MKQNALYLQLAEINLKAIQTGAPYDANAFKSIGEMTPEIAYSGGRSSFCSSHCIYGTTTSKDTSRSSEKLKIDCLIKLYL